MPELPEVETIRRSLLPLRGKRIVAVDVRERRMREPVAADLGARVADRRLLEIERRGKYLVFVLAGGVRLIAHLGMSGRIERRTWEAPGAPHDHVRILFDGGIALVLNDPRRFGLLRIAADGTPDRLLPRGRDPLVAPCTADDLRSLTRDRRLPIKNLLMDQRLIAGVGNIYANEILYEAGIRPRRGARRLGRKELERLARALRSVIERAVLLGGSSISDFRDANGRSGFFQMEHAVYDRAGEPCRRCRTTIRRVILSGRSSFYCPRCQR